MYSKELIKLLKQNGWQEISQNGSHLKMRRRKCHLDPESSHGFPALAKGDGIVTVIVYGIGAQGDAIAKSSNSTHGNQEEEEQCKNTALVDGTESRDCHDGHDQIDDGTT